MDLATMSGEKMQIALAQTQPGYKRTVTLNVNARFSDTS